MIIVITRVLCHPEVGFLILIKIENCLMERRCILIMEKFDVGYNDISDEMHTKIVMSSVKTV